MLRWRLRGGFKPPRIRLLVALIVAAELIMAATPYVVGKLRSVGDTQSTGNVARADTLPRSENWTGLVFLQPSDCYGNLAQLRPLLAAYHTDSTIRIELIDVSAKSQVQTIRENLPPDLADHSVRHINRKERQLLKAMGHGETPVTVLLDHRQRVRMILSSEAEPSRRVASMRAVLHLLLGDPGQ